MPRLTPRPAPFSVAVLTALALTTFAAPMAIAAKTSTVEYVLTENHGNPEGVAWDPGTQSFFTGTVADGTIYRGTLGDTSVDVWIPGAGTPAVGMKVDHGYLFVAGGPSGRITVYNIETRAIVRTFETGAGGFLNDLVVTQAGIFVTDSFRPVIWHISWAQMAAGGGTPEAISVSPEIPFTGGFALNGIVAFNGGRELIVVHSTLGTLYRIDLTADGRTITQLDAPEVHGDGLLVDQGMLIVVIGDAGNGQLAFLALSGDHSSATSLGTLTDPTFQRPSTLARAHNTWLIVNADFTTSTPPFTVSGIPRNG